MVPAQRDAWFALMSLADHHPDGWALIGGELVRLLRVERGFEPMRVTRDVDTIVSVNPRPSLLGPFTQSPRDLGFEPEISGGGAQHRWVRGRSVVDVLIPRGEGAVVEALPGAGGAPTVPAPGGAQALARAETVAVEVEGHSGFVLRPSLVGALVVKAAAQVEGDRSPGVTKHCEDFLALAEMVGRRDLLDAALSKNDRRHLRRMIERCRPVADRLTTPDAAGHLDRLSAWLG